MAETTPKKTSFFNKIKTSFGKLFKRKPKAAKTSAPVAKDAQAKDTAEEKVKNQATVTELAKKEGPLTKEERASILKAQKLYEEGIASIKDIIAPSTMKISYDHFQLGPFYAKSFVVYAYSRYLDTNWLSPVTNFDVTMDISMFIYPIDSAQILKTLRNKVAQMESSIRINQEKGNVRDPAIQHAVEDAEELRDKLQQGIEKFFQFACYFTVYSEDQKQLPHLTKQLETLLGGKLILTKTVQARTEQAFNSCAPYCTDELYVVRNMNTEPLAASFPFTSSTLSQDRGILYGINRHNNSLVVFDRFSLPNANSVVFATSGAGKSYAVKLEVLRSLMFGTDVIVIDPENEYEELAETIGGTYLKVSLNSNRRINPFDLPLPIEGQEEQPGDLLRSNIIMLQGLMGLMLGDLNTTEKAILDQAIVEVYALKGINMDTLEPSSVPPPTMGELQEILEDTKGGEDLAKRMAQYTTGIFSGIFNKPTNVDLKSGLVVFSIRDLDEQLRPIAMYIILNYIWTKVRSELKKRLLIIEEAWTLMRHDDSAEFLFGLVKRARKYYLGVTNISQDIDDFVSHEHGKKIINNSALQLLMLQAPAAIPALSDMFNLTEAERYYLLNAKPGDGIFFAGLSHVAIHVIASLNEDRLITTNPEEVLEMRKKKEKFEAM